ncbi:MAG: polyprenol monophosphomannose synthase [Propionibacteriaceae bacterium]|jgi:glycosyltransferase involved in cell wall biosynthesis|nr:polyprenol monophosphomannose synthase [Propionibacteriaceae bacterium]
MAYSYASLGRLLVIIPTYNEADNIESIVSRVRQSVPEADILIADDASPDHTGRIADELSLRDPQVHVLHRPAKEGLGTAYLAGFGWGLGRGYDVLIETDADGSHQPEELPMLLAALVKADMVKGSRWMRGGRVVNWSRKRELLSRAANIWVMAAMNVPIHDATGGYNLFRADMLRKIDLESVESRGYSFQVDMTRRVLEAGGTVAEVPIEFCERLAGKSKMSGGIIKEALLRTAEWGLERRSRQILGWANRAKKHLEPLTEKFARS